MSLSLFHSLEAEPSIRVSSLMLCFLNILRPMIPAVDAVLLAAPPILVLILLLDLLPVLLAILKLDFSSTQVKEDALASLDSILTPPKPSNATNVLPSTAQSAILPDQSNASPVSLEPPSELVIPAPVELDTLSMELPANNAPTNAKPAALPMEPVPHASMPFAEILPKTVNALLDSMIPELSTAQPVTQPVRPAPTDHPVPPAQFKPQETSPLLVCAPA